MKMKMVEQHLLCLLLFISPAVRDAFGTNSIYGRRSIFADRSTNNVNDCGGNGRSLRRSLPQVILHAGREKDTQKNPKKFVGSNMTITEYPKPVLRQRGDEITDFDDDFQQTCKEMVSIMYQADGVGLAAPQVDLKKRLFVYNPTGDKRKPEMERIVVNPEILSYSGMVDVDEEACLSSRSGRCAGHVCRATELMVKYKNERGMIVTKKLKGFEARVFQHEYDHVDGVLHLDRFCPEDRENIQPELDVLVDEYDGDDGILEITKEVRDSLQPPILIEKGWKPSLPELPDLGFDGQGKKKKKKSGGGGFGGFGKK